MREIDGEGEADPLAERATWFQPRNTGAGGKFEEGEGEGGALAVGVGEVELAIGQ